MIIRITITLNTLRCQKIAKVGQARCVFYIKSSSVYDNATI